MTFPLQTQFAHLRREVIRIGIWRLHAELLAERYEMRPFVVAFFSADRDRYIRCARRRLQRFGWARVNLIRQLDALGMITG